jgi:hypothetical protein
MDARWLAIAVVVLVSGFAATCRAEPFEDCPTNEDLRRELAELRQTVAELRERIHQLEYQQLPRLRPQTVQERPAPPALPSGLRFPIEVERAMMMPVGWPLRRHVR